MAVQKKELDYAKEVGDVGVALEKIVRDIRQEKQIGDIVSGSLQSLIDAVAGADQMDDEMKANRKAAFATMGYHTGEITDALLA